MRIKSRISFLKQTGRAPSVSEVREIEAGEAKQDSKLNDHAHHAFTALILLGLIGFSNWGLHAQVQSQIIWGLCCGVAAFSAWAYHEQVKSFFRWILPKLTNHYDYLG